MKYSLKNLHLASPIEIFEQASTHLISQGHKCLNKENNCVYHENHLRCARDFLYLKMSIVKIWRV